MDDYANAHRPAMPELSVAERAGNFREVELGFDEQTASEEAKRCLRCDLEWLDWMGIARPQRAVQAQAQQRRGLVNRWLL